MDQPELIDQENQGLSLWQKLVLALFALLVIVIVVAPGVLLYIYGADGTNALTKFRDITIVYLGLLWVVIFLLLAVMVFVMIWVAFQIKNRVTPLLEQILDNVRGTTSEVTETTKRARGTVEFVTEQLAKPVISVIGTASKYRTMAKMFVVDKDKKK